MKKMKKIAILTSGANASGMNFIIRSVTKYAYHESFEVIGFCDGFLGLMNNSFVELNTDYVDDIIDIGGTILHTTITSDFAHSLAKDSLAKDSLAKD
jgi:6-phosphofructokinase 1